MRTLKSHFRFTKKQRSGIFLFMILLIGSEVGIQILKNHNSNKTEIQSQIPDEVLALQAEIDSHQTDNDYEYQKISIQNFNPNELSRQDWVKLGFSSKQVDVILKYKNSLGGNFSSKQEIKECFVISDEKFNELEPYLLLPNSNPKNNYTKTSKQNTKYQYPSTKIQFSNFNPNHYSKEDWMKIGFSAKQADVILNYKQSLGGKFQSKQELKECFVISESKYLELKPYLLLPEKSNLKVDTNNQKTDNQKQVTKIHYTNFNPNEYSKEDWMKIGFTSKQVKTILNYKRSLGGEFSSLDEIKKCYVISNEKFEELKPYLILPEKKSKNFSNTAKKEPTRKNEQPTINKTINQVAAKDLFPYVSSKKVANTFVNYRRSLGGFKNRQQIEKVYGITKEEVDEILKIFPLD